VLAVEFKFEHVPSFTKAKALLVTACPSSTTGEAILRLRLELVSCLGLVVGAYSAMKLLNAPVIEEIEDPEPALALGSGTFMDGVRKALLEGSGVEPLIFKRAIS
jgi:hypothetical protein